MWKKGEVEKKFEENGIVIGYLIWFFHLFFMEMFLIKVNKKLKIILIK